MHEIHEGTVRILPAFGVVVLAAASTEYARVYVNSCGLLQKQPLVAFAFLWLILWSLLLNLFTYEYLWRLSVATPGECLGASMTGEGRVAAG